MEIAVVGFSYQEQRLKSEERWLLSYSTSAAILQPLKIGSSSTEYERVSFD